MRKGNMDMNTNRLKLFFGLTAFFALAASARVLGQTNDLPNIAPDTAEAGILTAMVKQMINNPSSAIVVPALMVLAWLADDLPFIPSRYVAHYVVIAGMLSFRFFCLESSVPKCFPHPQAVFVVNGMMAGFVAFVFHKYAVARFINSIRGQEAGTQINAVKSNQP
jgi:uncharacterized membrane protein